MKYVIGTRGSRLALAQAKDVQRRLKKAYPADEFEIQAISTKGDAVKDKPLREIGGAGVFVNEIEKKLLAGEIQIGVHSMKDMPAYPMEGLMITKAWKREDPRDALVLREKKSLWDLPMGAAIGTGSPRRKCQLLCLRQDLNIVDIRGNVDTRLRKMEEEKLDGVALAAAGLIRLGMEDRITQYLDTDEMIPAPGQGILGLEILKGQTRLLEMLNALSDEETDRQALAERSFLREIGGSCHLPIGAVCETKDGAYVLRAMFASGKRQVYVEAMGTDPKELAWQAASSVRKQMAGTVFLVGAGPGDPGLITVKGLAALRRADCIVYDRHIPPELLAEAKDGCELIAAGKEKGHAFLTQDEINRLLAQKSLEYETVVRLKGGDPYVFGRGGEEALFLSERGVKVFVVPGVSSCVAALAYAGIPATHRGKSRGFHVVTAHDATGELSDIDFEALAKSGETCVFLMGLSKTGEIADGLMRAGMPKEMPVAVISRATTPDQKTCVSDLGHIADATRCSNLASPAVIVAGPVVSLRRELNFFEHRPLSGKRYLIPKIGAEPTRLKELLEEMGAYAQEAMVGEIVYAERVFSQEELAGADWLVFTSKHGADAFFACLAKSGLDARSLAGCKIAAIGKKTGDILLNHGIRADLVPKTFDGESFSRELNARLKGGETVWRLKAEHADARISEALRARCNLKEVTVYQNRPVTPDIPAGGTYEDFDGVLFTCTSSVRRLVNAMGNEFLSCGLYSIGPATTRCLKECGADSVIEAETATYEGLAETLLNGRGLHVKSGECKKIMGYGEWKP